MSRHLVFVYGTLKRGQPNEYLINDLKHSKFIGKAVTCEKYPLVIGGPWRLPYLLRLEGKGKVLSNGTGVADIWLLGNKGTMVDGLGQNVKGDVIEVDDEALEKLDVFEDHPNWYERMLTEVELTDKTNSQSAESGASVLKCWAYFCKKYDTNDVNSPHYDDYDSYGDHGQAYDISENDEHPSNKEKDKDESS